MTTQFREFQAHVRRQNGTAIVDLSGVLDSQAEAALEAAYAEATATPAERILLNFAEVDYINSTGIALIVGILAKARRTHLPLITAGLSAHYQEIFRITRLSDFMGIYPDESTALAAI